MHLTQELESFEKKFYASSRAIVVAVTATSLVVSGSVFAKPDDGPPTVNVNVVNDPSSFDEHVVLHWRNDSDDVCSNFNGSGVGHLELPDRSVDPDPFVVPAGKVLVISRLSWNAFAGLFTPGEYLSVRLGTINRPLLRTGTVITNEIATAEYPAGNEYIYGGLLFHEGEEVRFTAGIRVGSTTTAGPSLNDKVLSGRLVDQ